MLSLHFFKYQATGNDFIILDGFKLKDIDLLLNREKINHLCNRNFGIGADGLIIVKPSGNYDFEMIYFNSDGNRASMCGNGGRCAIAFAIDNLICSMENEINFIFNDKIYTGKCLEKDKYTYLVSLFLDDVHSITQPIENMYFLNTGSPHLVCFVENVDNVDVFTEGRKLRYSDKLPEGGANVNFVEIVDDGIKVRTYERGVENETLSCGTGVTASAIVYSFHKKIYGQNMINVYTKGGKLIVAFNNKENSFSPVLLTGNATFVFQGFFNME